MSNSGSNSSLNNNSIQLHKLIRHVLGSQSGDKEELVSSHFRSALQLLSSSTTSYWRSAEVHAETELEITEKIKKQLVRENKSGNEAAKFSELVTKLNKSPIIKNREALLVFFYSLRDPPTKRPKIHPHFSTRATCDNNILRPSGPSKSPVIKPRLPPKPSLEVRSSSSSPTPVLGNEEPSQHLPTEGKTIVEIKANPETELIRELIYIFQGIEGKIIRRDHKNDSFRIIPSEIHRFPPPVVKLVLRLGELGWLFDKVHSFCQAQEEDVKNIGLIGQSFVSAIKDELTEYYRLLATLEATDSINLSHLTVWTLEPMLRIKTLASMVEACRHAKGGFLLSHIYTFLHHGNPSISFTVKSILCTVSKPMYLMILKWIVDGTLEDPYNEFFIASDPKVQSDRLWHNKYSIRRSMIPKFLSLSWVKKICATGKSINFLHQVCHDNSEISGRDLIKENLEATSPENLFSDPQDNLLHIAILRAYKETSNHVLSVIFTRYKFIDHVTAMRKYLLLGQGDIIRYLLELLEDELNKPASSLYPHNLAGILETAIRATNTQFEDQDILERLDVRLLEIQPGDTGWDVFSLDYKVDGPIQTVFRAKTMTQYLMLFNALWRAKRMEWLLSYVWKRQAILHKLAKNIPELSPILHIADLLSSEMIHFIHQMAYYITFEAIECSWDILVRNLGQAESLDEIIEAHEQFLDTLLKRALLDEKSRDILTQLRAIYDRIIEFQTIQSNLYNNTLNEVDARRNYELDIVKRRVKGEYGITKDPEEEYTKNRKDFIKMTLGGAKAQLKIVSQSYQDMVRTFLLQLTCSQDSNLQFLSFRLDFNQHYKRKDARIGTPLTFQHQRRTSGINQDYTFD